MVKSVQEFYPGVSLSWMEEEFNRELKSSASRHLKTEIRSLVELQQELKKRAHGGTFQCQYEFAKWLRR